MADLILDLLIHTWCCSASIVQMLRCSSIALVCILIWALPFFFLSALSSMPNANLVLQFNSSFFAVLKSVDTHIILVLQFEAVMATLFHFVIILASLQYWQVILLDIQLCNTYTCILVPKVFYGFIFFGVISIGSDAHTVHYFYESLLFVNA